MRFFIFIAIVFLPVQSGIIASDMDKLSEEYMKIAQNYGTKEITLRLEPQQGNPRNSEGDFIQLKDGRILFIYTHFTGGTGDHASAYLAGRYSNDGGKTWTKEDDIILPNEGGMNIMSVSLLRLNTGEVALFYLRKNSESDCIPFMRISNDEASTWSEPIRCLDAEGYHVVNNDRFVQLQKGRSFTPRLFIKQLSQNWRQSDKSGVTILMTMARPGSAPNKLKILKILYCRNRESLN